MIPNDTQIVSKWCPVDAQMIPKLYSNNTQMMSRWSANNAHMMSKWIPNNAQMASKRYPNDPKIMAMSVELELIWTYLCRTWVIFDLLVSILRDFGFTGVELEQFGTYGYRSVCVVFCIRHIFYARWFRLAWTACGPIKPPLPRGGAETLPSPAYAKKIACHPSNTSVIL